ncbi:hypothetical protein VNO80_10531 [Phaseolus coccineus]|uniref:Uncharacterized protein n=1 Tax=Phaseolus coccineus TaxID=3886 RepID=A0AAN9N8B8_PHACN
MNNLQVTYKDEEDEEDKAPPPTNAIMGISVTVVFEIEAHSLSGNLVRESIVDDDEVLEVLVVSKVVGDVAKDVGRGGA